MLEIFTSLCKLLSDKLSNQKWKYPVDLEIFLCNTSYQVMHPTFEGQQNINANQLETKAL